MLIAINTPVSATTIAYDGHYMACDSQATTYKLKKFYTKKVSYSKSRKAYVGGCGVANDCDKFRAWFCGELELPLDWKGEFEAICAYEDGRVTIYKDGIAADCHFDSNAPYIAIGSGEDLAMAAMYLGKSAWDAVGVAKDMDIFTGGPIYTYEVIKPGVKKVSKSISKSNKQTLPQSDYILIP